MLALRTSIATWRTTIANSRTTIAILRTPIAISRKMRYRSTTTMTPRTKTARRSRSYPPAPLPSSFLGGRARNASRPPAHASMCLRAPATRLRAPESRLQAPASRLPARVSRLPARVSRLPARASCFQALASRLQAHAPRLRAPASHRQAHASPTSLPAHIPPRHPASRAPAHPLAARCRRLMRRHRLQRFVCKADARLPPLDHRSARGTSTILAPTIR